MSEVRLIDAEALKQALHNFFDGKVIDEPTYILRDVFCYIDNAPTVERPQSEVKKMNNKDAEKVIEELKKPFIVSEKYIETDHYRIEIKKKPNSAK